MGNIRLYFAKKAEQFLLYAARKKRNRRKSKKSNWDNISIGQFQRIILAKETAISDASMWAEIVSIIEGLEYKEVMEWPVSQLNKSIASYKWVNDDILNTHVDNSFIIDDIEYFITKDLTSVTTGQMIDNAAFCENTSQVVTNMHKILALFCLPSGQKDHTVNFEKRANIFQEKLSINVAYGLSSFFLRSSIAYLALIQNYWMDRVKQEAGMKNDGDG